MFGKTDLFADVKVNVRSYLKAVALAPRRNHQAVQSPVVTMAAAAPVIFQN